MQPSMRKPTKMMQFQTRIPNIFPIQQSMHNVAASKVINPINNFLPVPRLLLGHFRQTRRSPISHASQDNRLDGASRNCNSHTHRVKSVHAENSQYDEELRWAMWNLCVWARSRQDCASRSKPAEKRQHHLRKATKRLHVHGWKNEAATEGAKCAGEYEVICSQVRLAEVRVRSLRLAQVDVIIMMQPRSLARSLCRVFVVARVLIGSWKKLSQMLMSTPRTTLCGTAIGFWFWFIANGVQTRKNPSVSATTTHNYKFNLVSLARLWSSHPSRQ